VVAAVVLIVQAVVFATLSGIVASNKNRDPAGWGIIGLLFGLFGFIAAIAMGEVEEKSQSASRKSQPSDAREFNPDEHEKKCPMCAEYIKLEARRCKHCGYEFSDEEVEKQIEEERDSIEKEQKYDTDEALSTHKFNGIVCEDCGKRGHISSQRNMFALKNSLRFIFE